ncbi:MAG: 50S ribosomal protein L25/general stress protein Ctc [Actinomycetota bacterium]|nr:50S ribosomal protein L25/general stress protein Ctc [Actinomycetota bacterium]
MAEVKLPAEKRTEVGKGHARRARAAGRVPGIVYGKGMEPVAVEVSRRELVTAFHSDAGMNTLLDIELEGTTTLALARELQRDPVKGTLLHVDFVKIDRKQAVEVEVPVHMIGEAPGQKEGGVLENPLFQLHVRCLPLEVPESIEVDISSLNIGDSLRVQDISTDDKFEILNDPDAAVVAIAAPVSEEELEAMEAAASGPAMEGVEAEGEAAPAEDVEAEAPAEEAPADGGDGDEGSDSEG